MKAKTLNSCSLLLILMFYNTKTMAQSQIIITNQNAIIAAAENTQSAALILKNNLDKAFKASFKINPTTVAGNPEIILEITNSDNEIQNQNEFIIKSDTKSIYLKAKNEKYLRYAVYTLLEMWGFRKYTAAETFIPRLEQILFDKNYTKKIKPDFEYRSLLYPDAYDPDFRDWHKLDLQIYDFSLWGHSFNTLVPAKDFFKDNPKLFALYEGQRNTESLCMTNDTVVELVTEKMKKIIAQNPNAVFFSVSQNDDVVYCECSECKALNAKYGGPQGSLYSFLNKIATQFPTTKITTLAYLHTQKPPLNLKIEPNIYTLFCPIELDRGKPLNSQNSASFIKTLENWSATSPHLYLWDYSVQFANYFSPFPNIHTFSENYKTFKKNNVKGLFVQGYADILGDFSELRQYLLAKLLWDTSIDIEATTADFLRGFYGKTTPFINQYLNLLAENQTKSNTYLDIYSGPVQSRNTFLTPEAITEYDHLLEKASVATEEDPILNAKVLKLRLALEYVFFEQSKFYGKNQHGMFIVNEKGEKEVKQGLTNRVLNFTKACNDLKIYELSEAGLSPDDYYKEWLEIAKNTTSHLGETLKVNFITHPSNDFEGKGSESLVDGNRGYRDFNINWIGWYDANPEFEILTQNLDFTRLKINFLEDQRHWIFLPKAIKIYGYKNQNWELIKQYDFENFTENYETKSKSWQLTDESFKNFIKIKILIENQTHLPDWRKRKNKKPMVMIDEIELYKK
ncbi:DUF4838 domain-containing protein [Flavobacterium sp. Fl-77]|uniref:DUF4838 domain-containing protein n=1 Tax=Flavobacterium flavipigmentatum TaxID=2893884 RepID=A0AAJ2SA25_9FLAO|nr:MULTISPECIES: DUF4838 domain-containing protein [unclassified Flavobacterium]MDX6181727.1 DUF4838 domain-containing protein [Flavobacterium sp. Fl-33]MDX6185239.1 DUF4838 domain-containing protein [Flavobacterium sp. Fl-77]UFH37345.1 DUF4838 domain-containing protein [Flavobacterium sp. F-70]